MPGRIEAPVGEENWQARSDADTLARANEILGDPMRLNAAKIEVTNMATEQMEQVKSLMTVTGRTFNQTFKGMEINEGQSMDGV